MRSAAPARRPCERSQRPPTRFYVSNARSPRNAARTQDVQQEGRGHPDFIHRVCPADLSGRTRPAATAQTGQRNRCLALRCRRRSYPAVGQHGRLDHGPAHHNLGPPLDAAQAAVGKHRIGLGRLVRHPHIELPGRPAPRNGSQRASQRGQPSLAKTPPSTASHLVGERHLAQAVERRLDAGRVPGTERRVAHDGQKAEHLR